ncbi:RteC domain-containing protein [Flavobacterium azooxidireducens]|uniref:RteC domain-containing protein n=1 Tax=Flavobacterium azooxidireducens TaxID=1871076 RepID=A0ABY4KBY9_9FLAO|nr:RteC domain-containing protein [Flavobacterium azooxidireducens]UPQ78305.1 RteC domain-containing protein [Flavobacterium azooxidireducens]
MKNFANQLFLQLDLQLTKILPLVEEDPIQNCSLAINILMEGYEKLRTSYINHTTSQEEEIDFFKNWKPKLTSQIIYFNEMFNIECNKPVASEKTIRKYYNTQLKKREQFFIDNAEFYRYYRKGNQYLDDKYFLRNQQDSKLVMDSFYFQIDKLFATSHDYKVAQILSNEKLQIYLIAKLKSSTESKAFHQEKVLKWTGSKVGIIELIYALHTEGVFNHGAADIGEIVQGFSRTFDIDLGQFHRTFYEITNRKSERTKFITSLRENLLNRMNNSDEHQRLP